MKEHKKQSNQTILKGDAEENSEALQLGDILDRIVDIITKYITLPSEGLAMLIACWIAGTYTYQRFEYYGYLAIRSATLRCGKSQLLKLVALLCPGMPPVTTSPTAPVLYRNPRKIIILDEIDQLRNQDKDAFGAVLAVLNAGFEKGRVVERVERGGKEGFQLQPFSVYGPKALAGIEQLADTLADRTFAIVLKRAPTRPPRFRADRMAAALEDIRHDLTLWMKTHGASVTKAYQALPNSSPALEVFDDRFQDIAEPLVVIATLADKERTDGPKILNHLREGLTAAAISREPSGREEAIHDFLDLADTLVNGHEVRFIPTEELLEECGQCPELSWIQNGGGLAGLLRKFDLRSSSNGKRRGYRLRRSWIDEWRTHYPKPPTDEKPSDDAPPEEVY